MIVIFYVQHVCCVNGRVVNHCFHHDTGISSKVTVTPSTLIRIRHRDTARLFCNVKHSAPKAVISWRKKGENETITEGVRFTLTPNGALQIRNIRFEEQGQYECIAENTFTAKKHTSTNAASIEVIGGMVYTEYLGWTGNNFFTCHCFLISQFSQNFRR